MYLHPCELYNLQKHVSSANISYSLLGTFLEEPVCFNCIIHFSFLKICWDFPTAHLFCLSKQQQETHIDFQSDIFCYSVFIQ